MFGGISETEIREKFKPVINDLLKQNSVLKAKFKIAIKGWVLSLSKQSQNQEIQAEELKAEYEKLEEKRGQYMEAIKSKTQDQEIIKKLQSDVNLLKSVV